MRILSSVLLGVVGANLLFFGQPGFGFGTVGFFCTILLGVAIFFVRFFQTKTSRRQTLATVSGGLALLLAGLSLFRASDVDVFFLGIASLTSLCIMAYLFALTHVAYGAVSEVLVIPLRLVLAYIGAVLTVGTLLPKLSGRISQFFQLQILARVNAKVPLQPLLRGLLATGLIIFLLVGLLSSADPVFSSTLREMFSFSLPKLAIVLPARLVFSAVVAVMLSPLAFFSIRSVFLSPFAHSRYARYTTEFLMMTTGTGLVLGLFLLIQARYLFTAVPDITLQSFGIATYSEYVRRGFGELLLATLLVYAVIVLSAVVVRQKRTALLSRVNLVLLGEVLLLILSVFRRLALYQAQHGLTRIRIYGMVFLLTLGALTITMVWRHIARKQRAFYLYELGIFFAGFLLLAIINVDRSVAVVFRPTVNGATDYSYIARLSPDAVEGWIEAYREVRTLTQGEEYLLPTTLDDVVARRIVFAWETITRLDRQFTILYDKHGSAQERQIIAMKRGFSLPPPTSPLTFNLAEWYAYQQLREHINLNEFFETERRIELLYNQLTPQQRQSLYDQPRSVPLVR